MDSERNDRAILEDGILIPQQDHPWFRWFCPKPTVRILFYTDDPSIRFDPNPDFGVATLRDLIVSHNSFHATFAIDLIDRHDGGHAVNRLTPALLSGYDQVWFFGVQMCNLPNEPLNELTDPEVQALRAWMDAPGRRGGVLITGDHSNPRPPGADPGLNGLLNLGRALGHRVPRAGQLRVWEGLPDATIQGSHDTQVPDGLGTDLNNLTLQDDAFPQRVTLTKYPVGWIWPFWIRRYRPHPLFCGRTGPIEVFPDHMHEGALAIPAGFPAADWPSGPFGQPRPEIVAKGTDKRNGATYGLVTAYDGAQAGVGRIVADATWHHYFNVNLRGFPAGGPVLNSIADYYVNLAVWLSPAGKRQAMQCWFWWYLAVHPAVRMVAGHPLALIGQTAFDALGRRASQCMITEMIWPFPVLAAAREKLPWPPEEVLLGGVLDAYHRAFSAVAAGTDDRPSRDDLVRGGINAAVDEHVEQLRRMADAAGDVRGPIADGNRFVDEDRRSHEGSTDRGPDN
jgi:hypothetical protein